MDSFLWVSHRLGMGVRVASPLKHESLWEGQTHHPLVSQAQEAFLSCIHRTVHGYQLGQGDKLSARELRGSQGHGQLRKTEVS